VSTEQEAHYTLIDQLSFWTKLEREIFSKYFLLLNSKSVFFVSKSPNKTNRNSVKIG